MVRRFELRPGIAAYLSVTELGVDKEPQSAIFLSHEKGVVVGLHDRPMATSGWPIKVQDAILQHFTTVFALEHETWSHRGPSPRALYLKDLQPWIVEVEDEP